MLGYREINKKSKKKKKVQFMTRVSHIKCLQWRWKWENSHRIVCSSHGFPSIDVPNQLRLNKLIDKSMHNFFFLLFGAVKDEDENEYHQGNRQDNIPEYQNKIMIIIS